MGSKPRTAFGAVIGAVLTLFVFGGAAFAQEGPSVDTSEVRTTRSLDEGWSFWLLTPGGNGEWEADESGIVDVDLPHTWNATDAASYESVDYKRGVGWYQLYFDSPQEGARHWLEFGAASLVADVWLNGEHLGQHKGAFTAFRFDVTDMLNDNGEPNLLLVSTDNREATSNDDPTAIPPIGGDYNKPGGLYRYVSLISTADPVHFALGDSGGPGVYAATTSIENGDATVHVRAKLASDAAEAGDYTVRFSLLNADGQVAQTAEQTLPLEAGASVDVEQDLNVSDAHLWQGVEDPYLYDLVAEVVDASGGTTDKVVQQFGIRQVRFDPNEGLFLNGEHVRMHGVAMHQDYLGKSWAQSEEDWDTSFDLIEEIGANAVRFGHYPFPEYALERADEMGLVIWSETPSGQRTTVERCSTTGPTEAFIDSARQQLEEMVRQLSNHPAIVMWSVGNELEFGQLGCENPFDTVTPFVRELDELVNELDSTRPSAYAEFPNGSLVSGVDVEGGRIGPFGPQGITDVFGTNRYFLWYTPTFEEMGPLLDGLHALVPNQPLGITEYGAGAAITHHTDNPKGGYPDVRSAPGGAISYQPEEYAAYAHEENYKLIESKDYLWGAFVWNMFDFGSGHRNEGDVLGVNTKGLVTFGRETKKDPFYFYKANWSDEPVTYITGRRYTDRAYPVTDVKVYTNADSVELSVNGTSVGTMAADECEFMTCVFEDVQLSTGDNEVTAVGDHGGSSVTDTVEWSLDNREVNIAAGELVSGITSWDGTYFGSDDFFQGGEDREIIREGGFAPEETGVQGTDDARLFNGYRSGTFSYDIPLADGTYDVTLGFVEPDEDMEPGERIFNVSANGEMQLEQFDITDEAEGRTVTAVTKTFTLDVSGGSLLLEFTPSAGDAVVSNIRVRQHDSADGAADREYLVDVLTSTARPVLEALSDGELHERLPVHEWEVHREAFTHYEAFARTLAGIAPWLGLGPDDTDEGQLRAEFIDLAQQAVINATDPDSPDFMNFGGEAGDQPLVEAAYFASALMSAPTQLFEPLTPEQKENVLEALRTSRGIQQDHENNWWLFPAMVEAALWQLGADYDVEPIELGVEKIESWYLGDGIYGDGPNFHWDYYNSYVIHPMLLQVLHVAEENGHPLGDRLATAMNRADRYAEVLERLISPEGTFPVIGRSSAYRYATFYHLAYMALNEDLPASLNPGAVRDGITAVVREMTEAEGTYDDEGWLNLGAVGSQPGLREDYNATGSLYVTLTGLVHLGLPPDDPFWTLPDEDWTQKRVWSGQDVPRDGSLRE